MASIRSKRGGRAPMPRNTGGARGPRGGTVRREPENVSRAKTAARKRAAREAQEAAALMEAFHEDQLDDLGDKDEQDAVSDPADLDIVDATLVTPVPPATPAKGATEPSGRSLRQRRRVKLKPERTVRLGNGTVVKIGGFCDEHGVRFVWCKRGKNLAFTKYADWHGGASDASSKLREAGLVIVKNFGDLQSAVNRLKRFSSFPVVTKPGWSDHGFALPDGRVLVGKGQPKPLTAFAPVDDMFASNGTLAGWIEHVAAPLAAHRFPSFFMMMMFAAPLLHLTNRSDNFGFEIAGEGGLGKSTLQALVATAAGLGIGSVEGTYWRSMNTTMNALEAVLSSYNDLPLILDESGLVSGAGRGAARALTMRELAFRLAAGVVKHRFGEKPGPRSRTIFLISTNLSIASLPGNGIGPEGEAIADRLMTIPLGAERPFGIFDSCPPEFASTSAFAEALKEAGATHYGHALPAFLDYLAGRVSKDKKSVRKRIDRYVQLFVRHSGANVNNGSEKRVADAFGLIYAAGKIAQRAGVLPASYKCGRVAKATYRLHRSQGRTNMSIEDQLRALLINAKTVDLTKVKIKSLSPVQVSECPAFIYQGKSGGRELLVPVDRIEFAIPRWKAKQNDPQLVRRLRVSSERKTRDRPVGLNGASISMYVFDLTDL